MSNKTVTFSEPGYEELQYQIIEDGLKIARLIKTPPDGYALAAQAIDVAAHATDSDLFCALLDDYQPGNEATADSGHSGASWSAVRWAVLQFLCGYEVEVKQSGTLPAKHFAL